MNHPFNLNLSDLEAVDLDFEEQLSVEEAEKVGGGTIFTTLALGEEGGCYPPIIKDPCYPRPPIKWPLPCELPIDPPGEPPEVTTLALGEEGGDCGFLE